MYRSNFIHLIPLLVTNFIECIYIAHVLTRLNCVCGVPKVFKKPLYQTVQIKRDFHRD